MPDLPNIRRKNTRELCRRELRFQALERNVAQLRVFGVHRFKHGLFLRMLLGSCVASRCTCTLAGSATYACPSTTDNNAATALDLFLRPMTRSIQAMSAPKAHPFCRSQDEELYAPALTSTTMGTIGAVSLLILRPACVDPTRGAKINETSSKTYDSM